MWAMQCGAHVDKRGVDAGRGAEGTTRPGFEPQLTAKVLASTKGVLMADAKARQELADAEKAEAAAAEARTAAARAAREFAEWDSELSRRAREAASQSAITAAQNEGTDAVSKLVATYIPDLSNISQEPLSATGDAIHGPLVSNAALGEAAAMVKRTIVDHVGGPLRGTVLITSDPDLVASDAAHLAVVTGLERLHGVADHALEVTTEKGRAAGADQVQEVAPTAVDEGLTALAAAAAPAAAVVASVLSPILSLVSARRSLSSAAASLAGTAAVASVASELRGPETEVAVDRFRLLPTEGPILDDEAELLSKRQQLADRRRQAVRGRRLAEVAKADAQDRLEDARKQRDDAQDDAGRSTAAQVIGDALQDRAIAAAQAVEFSEVEEVLGGVIEAIEAFLTAIRTAPEDGVSPLVAALLREGLRDRSGAFDWVLFVGSATGSTTQLFSDQPLWADDKFAVLGSVTLPFLLLNATTGALEATGTGFGSAQLGGKIGSDVQIRSVRLGQ